MKKHTKKIISIIFSLILLLSSRNTAFAAICVPHTTYPVAGKMLNISYYDSYHPYVKLKYLPDGTTQKINASYKERKTVVLILEHYVCSKCYTTTYTTTRQEITTTRFYYE